MREEPSARRAPPALQTSHFTRPLSMVESVQLFLLLWPRVGASLLACATDCVVGCVAAAADVEDLVRRFPAVRLEEPPDA